MSYQRWLLIAAFLFSLGLVLGLSTPPSSSGLLPENVTALEKFAEFLEPLPQPTVLVIIFVKNVSALLLSFALSPIFCLVPVVALVFNGWLLGIVSTAVIEEQSLGYLLAGLLPHGIFELPAFIMGEAVALSFGATALLTLFKKEGKSLLRHTLRQNLRYLGLALLLLLPAAVIETYLIPWILG